MNVYVPHLQSVDVSRRGAAGGMTAADCAAGSAVAGGAVLVRQRCDASRRGRETDRGGMRGRLRGGRRCRDAPSSGAFGPNEMLRTGVGTARVKRFYFCLRRNRLSARTST